MKRLQDYVTTLPERDTIRFLAPSQDGKPNVFHRVFDLVLQSLVPDEAWAARLWLLATSQKFDILSPNFAIVRGLVDDLQTVPVVATHDQYMQLIQAIFAEPSVDDAAIQEQASLALRVVDTMYERGEKTLTNDVIIAIIESLVRSGAEGKRQNGFLGHLSSSWPKRTYLALRKPPPPTS